MITTACPFYAQTNSNPNNNNKKPISNRVPNRMPRLNRINTKTHEMVGMSGWKVEQVK